MDENLSLVAPRGRQKENPESLKTGMVANEAPKTLDIWRSGYAFGPRVTVLYGKTGASRNFDVLKAGLLTQVRRKPQYALSETNLFTKVRSQLSRLTSPAGVQFGSHSA